MHHLEINEKSKFIETNGCDPLNSKAFGVTTGVLGDISPKLEHIRAVCGGSGLTGRGIVEFMAERPNKFEYEELLACGRGEMFGPGNAQLPLPPMLMFDRISAISEEGGEHGKGLVRAEFAIKPDQWFFSCHFHNDPVMPGCLGLDALWQMLGFYLGWLGGEGRGRALSVGEVKFSGMVIPTVKLVEYGVDLKRVIQRKLTLGIGDGWLKADGETIYRAVDLRVGLFAGEPG